MPKRWHQFRNPWDREYAMRGSLWRGVSDASFLREWVPPGARVVELGCGDGKFLAGLDAAGFAPVGVDFSRHALRRARERAPTPAVLADVRALPFRDGAFPAVAARYVLGALDETGRRASALEMRRVLAPQGVLLVEEFSTADFRAGTGREVEPRTFERNRGIITHYFERGEVSGLLPELEAVLTEEVASVQRTREGAKERRRWRWVLRRSA